MKTTIALAFVLALVAAGAAFAQPHGEAVVYDGPYLNGRNYVLRGDVPNFEPIGFNDRTSSIRVVRGTWEFCTDANYQGRCKVYGPGDYRDLGRQGDRISSARQVRGRPPVEPTPRLTLYDGRDFSGRSLTLDMTAPNLEPSGFNDRARSMIIEHGRWRLCSDAHGRGHCEDFGPGRYAQLPPELRHRLSSVFLK
jgi:hypothetical protein